MVDSGALSGRRELTKASLSSLSWIIQSPPAVAFLKKNSPNPPYCNQLATGKQGKLLNTPHNFNAATHKSFSVKNPVNVLTSSFLSFITTAGTSRKGDIGTPLLFPSLRKVHCHNTSRDMFGPRKQQGAYYASHKGLCQVLVQVGMLHMAHSQNPSRGGGHMEMHLSQVHFGTSRST